MSGVGGVGASEREGSGDFCLIITLPTAVTQEAAEAEEEEEEDFEKEEEEEEADEGETVPGTGVKGLPGTILPLLLDRDDGEIRSFLAAFHPVPAPAGVGVVDGVVEEAFEEISVALESGSESYT